jgi:hypothetical protein
VQASDLHRFGELPPTKKLGDDLPSRLAFLEFREKTQGRIVRGFGETDCFGRRRAL